MLTQGRIRAGSRAARRIIGTRRTYRLRIDSSRRSCPDRMDGRRKLYSRLGSGPRPDRRAAFERDRVRTPGSASLDRFIAWFSRGEVEIKRDASAPSNSVRVMTVHGAKGLEAPIVILADATADPARLGGVERTLNFPVPRRGQGSANPPPEGERVSPFSELIANEEARTWRSIGDCLRRADRAEERLVDRRLQPQTKAASGPKCWHTSVERALSLAGRALEEAKDWGQVLRYRGTAVAGAVQGQTCAHGISTLPSFQIGLRMPAPPEARPPQPLAPSPSPRTVSAPPPPSEPCGLRHSAAL